jgi:hypothetical protein
MVASADTMFDVLDGAFGSVGEIYFRRFMKSSLTDKWMIAADFVIGAPEAVHDVFAFTVFPHYQEFTETLAGIAAIFPRDLKRTKVLTDEMVTFLRDTKRFHFCFLVDKYRYINGSVEGARRAIAHAIRVVEGLESGALASGEERRDSYIRALRIVEEEAKAKRFNFRNFIDIHILGVLLATLMLWIARHGECRVVGLFPDRDKMTAGYKAVFNVITDLNHSGLCQRIGLIAARNIIAPSAELLQSPDLFYDSLVRIPDYVAGALSRLDYHSRVLTSERAKHKDLIERFTSDNPNLLITQISESIISLRASTIRLTTEPNRFPPVSIEEWVEYIIAKAQGFRQPQRRSFRQDLLDHASEWPHFSRMLRSLLRGVAAGHHGCVAVFNGEM